MGETMGEHDFGDFFTREFSDFAEDGPGGGGNFRGRGGGGGGGPWRGGGRGGRGGGGHFNDNGFGFGGPRGGPRFRGGRGGFMGGPNMRGGPGPRGPGPGFRGGHFERPFRPQGGGWNGPPGHNMGHGGGGGGGGGNDFMSPGGGSDSSDLVIWAETKTDTGSVYYYNTKTRSTSWDRPEGSGIKIMSHEEWSAMMSSSGEGARFSEHESPDINKPGFSDQGPPQGPGGFGPRPSMGGPNPGNLMQGPPGQQVRPPGNMGPPPSVNPFTAALGQTQNPFRPPGPANPFSPGENGFTGGQEEKDDSGNLQKPPVVPVGMPPQQRPPMMAPQQGPIGFPPFPSMTSVPPPFGLSFPQNFPMVPPPWNPMSGVPPPTGVPPPMMTPVDPVLQHMDPQVVARAFDWTEHMSPDGKPYYFNAKTQTSVWEKPPPIIEYETAKAIAQQRVMQQAMMNATKEKLTDATIATSESNKSKDGESKKPSSGDKCRPVSSTPVTGTPWCVVWTGDKRVFFYNPSTKTSVWERPQDLIGRMDVEEMLRNVPTTKNIPPAIVKKAEATSTTESANNTGTASSALISANQTSSAAANATSETTPLAADGADAAVAAANKADWAGKFDSKIVINLDKRVRDKDEISIASGAPPEKKPKTDEIASENGALTEVITIGSDDEKQEEQKAALQEKNALEAEVLAARERAVVPLETRLQQFREMLVEKQVSAFSVWEKELHKIVFDSRYLLLTSKERKTAFENYVKERAEEERKEKKSRLKAIKEKFLQFLEDVNVLPKMTYNEFAQKHGRDERYKIIEKSRDREAYFIEYQMELKRKDKESRSHKKDKVKDDFTLLLKDRIKDYHVKWADVRKKFEDPRYDILDNEEKEELFRLYQKKLKAEIKYKEKKKKKKLKKQKREKLRSSRTRTESKSERDPNEEDQGDVDTEDVESARSGDAESDKMEDVSDEEEREEGAISDDSEEDPDDVIERARKERAEISMREREREVQRTLATHLRDRDKEREFYRHEEAIQDFQAQLTDCIRTSDATWKDSKKILKKDRRWESVSILSREEMEDIFTQHCETIARKKKLRFRDLLVEARVKLNSNWRDVRKKIRDDPRFQKYSTDERKCEREFSMYLKDLATQMKSDFRALLKETKMLNYKSKLQIRENPQILKDVEALLEKDKRFLNLDCMADERQRLLAEYLDELERKGPPPPPTASEPSRRLK